MQTIPIDLIDFSKSEKNFQKRIELNFIKQDSYKPFEKHLVEEQQTLTKDEIHQKNNQSEYELQKDKVNKDDGKYIHTDNKKTAKKENSLLSAEEHLLNSSMVNHEMLLNLISELKSVLNSKNSKLDSSNFKEIKNTLQQLNQLLQSMKESKENHTSLQKNLSLNLNQLKKLENSLSHLINNKELSANQKDLLQQVLQSIKENFKKSEINVASQEILSKESTAPTQATKIVALDMSDKTSKVNLQIENNHSLNSSNSSVNKTLESQSAMPSNTNHNSQSNTNGQNQQTKGQIVINQEMPLGKEADENSILNKSENRFQIDHLKNKMSINGNSLDYRQLFTRLGNRIQMAISQNKQELNLKLYPENLGRVIAQIKKGDEGFVLKLTVENNAVRELIESRMQEFKDHLQKSGVIVDGLEISLGTSSKNNNGIDKDNLFEKQNHFNYSNQENLAIDETLNLLKYHEGLINLSA